MAGYYRKLCDNFSVIAEPLTNLLSKRTKFIWTNDSQKAFDILKAILKNEPVLLAPNFAKEFKLAVDVSDTGAGSVLMQEDGNGVDHPVSYFSKKFNKLQKNYSTIEKERLSLFLALRHFEVYLTSSPSPIVVFSDHNPLIFAHKMKNKNQRLLRWSLLLQEYNELCPLLWSPRFLFTHKNLDPKIGNDIQTWRLKIGVFMQPNKCRKALRSIYVSGRCILAIMRIYLLFSVLVVNLSGDVELNPGPPKPSEHRTRTRQQTLSFAGGADRRTSLEMLSGTGRLSSSPDGGSQRELFSYLAQIRNDLSTQMTTQNQGVMKEVSTIN